AVHIRWYSPRTWMFYPGISTDEDPGKGPCPEDPPACPPEGKKPSAPVMRGQSPADSDRRIPFDTPPAVQIAQAPKSPAAAATAAPPAPALGPPGGDSDEAASSKSRLAPTNPGGFCPPVQSDSIEPIMSYTRFFDGADRQLIQALRGYYILRGDMR